MKNSTSKFFQRPCRSNDCLGFLALLRALRLEWFIPLSYKKKGVMPKGNQKWPFRLFATCLIVNRDTTLIGQLRKLTKVLVPEWCRLVFIVRHGMPSMRLIRHIAHTPYSTHIARLAYIGVGRSIGVSLNRHNFVRFRFSKACAELKGGSTH